jgi:hypothetical protein
LFALLISEETLKNDKKKINKINDIRMKNMKLNDERLYDESKYENKFN